MWAIITLLVEYVTFGYGWIEIQRSIDHPSGHLPQGILWYEKIVCVLIYLLLLDQNIANMKFFEKDALLLK